MTRPNILIFNPDEMKADVLGCLGNPAGVTPNLDRFAAEDAAAFSQTYCQNPVCVPSRCSFMTGLYPHVFGWRTMEHPVSEVKPMFQELKESGYYVWMNNRNDFIKNSDVEAFKANADTTWFPRGPIVRGHDADPSHPTWTSRSFMVGFLPEETEDQPDRDADGVRGLMRFIKERPADQPFCAFLGLFNPHPPYGVEKRYYDAVDPSKIRDRIPNPDDSEKLPSMLRHFYSEMHLQLTEADWKEMQHIYYAMCLKVDDYFGQIIALLKEEGIYDDTDIYVLSDHGDFNGDYGLPEKNQNTFEDCLTRVPFMVKPHRGVPVQPGVRDGLTELVDFYATVMDLSGTAPTHSHFGRSLRLMLADPAVKGRDFVCCEGGRLDNEPQCMENSPFVLDAYVPRLGGQKLEPEHTKATMLRSDRCKYVKRLYETDEFYDLIKDPRELHNAIDDPEYREAILQMKLQLLDWYQETCDIVPFATDGRAGSVPMTLVSRYVPEEKQTEMKKKAQQGGFTLKEFEAECKNGERLTNLNLQLILN